MAKYKTKLNEDGTVASNGGLVTLVEEESGAEIQVDPAARHGKCTTFEREEPAKNAAAKTVQKKLEAFEDIAEKFPDLMSDPASVAKSLEELAALKADGKSVDEQIAALHTKYGGEIEAIKSEYSTKEQEYEGSIAGLKKAAQMQQFLIPWASSRQLEGYALPRDPDILQTVLLGEIDGQSVTFNDDGSVNGWDGAPIVDYANGNKPISDPDRILEIILQSHPKASKIKLSTLPGGGGMGGSAGSLSAEECEKHFKPETRNLTEQIKTKQSNPALYDQLKAKYSK